VPFLSLAFWLSIYATTVSTAVALLTLYGEIFQRVWVRAEEQGIVDLHGRPQRMRLAIADALEIPEADRTPVLVIVVRNRGRRPVQIQQLSKRSWFSTTRTLFTTEEVGELPAVIEGGHLRVFVVAGTKDPYVLGSTGSLSRTYAVDGAERIHPLRERWLQAIENVVFYRPRASLWKLRERRKRKP
jgi:hypothetical protein